MDISEFDKFAEEYELNHRKNIAITGEGPEYFAHYKIKEFARFAREFEKNELKILDFGAGIGNSIPYFRKYFPLAQLICADPSSRSITLSGQRFPGSEQYTILTGREIPHDDHTFAMSFSACVFHHIPHNEHQHWLKELFRVTQPGGILTIFEHNPLNPLTVHAVSTCPFDKNAHLIEARALVQALSHSEWSYPTLRYHIFFPRILARLRPLERYLGWLPLGAQYSLTVRRV